MFQREERWEGLDVGIGDRSRVLSEVVWLVG